MRRTLSLACSVWWVKSAGVLATKDYLFLVVNDGINEKCGTSTAAAGSGLAVPMPSTGTAGIEPYDPAHSNEIFTCVSTWNQPKMVYDYTPQNPQHGG